MTSVTLGSAVLVVIAVSVPVGRAQTKYIEVPKWDQAGGSREAADFLLAPRLGEMPTHAQYLYSVWDFGVPSAWLSGVSFRQQLWITDMAVCQVTMTVQLSHAQIAPSEATEFFAQNLGQDVTTVFNGKVSWPGVRVTDPPSFVAALPFDRQFMFVSGRGKSLVMDVRSHSSTLGSGEAWYAAVAIPDRGRGTWNWLNGGACWSAPYSMRHPDYLNVGGAYAKRYSGLPKNARCFASIGVVGVGGMWGGLKLPIWLAGNCWWAATADVVWPFQTDGVGDAVVPGFSIPQALALKGLHFFDQDGCLTPALNALGFVTLVSMEWIIGSGSTPNGAMVYVTNDTIISPTGSRWTGQVTIARFWVP